MSGYRPLFRIVVGHDFFDTDPCPAVALVPSRRSVEVASRAGLFFRDEPGGIAVLHEGDREDALELWASELADDFRLDFRLVPDDPLFSEYTFPAVVRDDAILAFDNLGSTTDRDDGPVRLSKEEHVSGKDFAELDSNRVAAALTARDRLIRPTAIVSIHLADQAGTLLDPDPGDSGRIYRLDFRARETYWRYLLMGGLARKSASVTDPDEVTQFESGGETVLPGDRKALAFRSRTPIPLRERSSRRFQLKLDGTEGAGTGPVLVPRLPVASARGIHRAVIDGESAFVSDIFVNG